MAKILVIDDDASFRETTRIVLEKSGHTILEARNGNAGFELARAEKPDLIILDVIMDSILDGLSVSQQMYDNLDLRNIPIVMVTSIASTDYAELFPTDDYIHFSAFLSKPVAPETLISQIEKLLPKS
ncbi:MAG: response regulator [Anaerolineales bacterium]|nr:response regulator [Anaerolineales bacterium]